jgi:ComF family protein
VPVRAGLLCGPCLDAIPRLALELCAKCLLQGREPVGCTRHAGFRVHPSWVYDERAALVVHALKFASRTRLARSVAGDLARVAPRDLAADLILDLPLHPVRRRERGYNQAACLAEALSDAIGVPYVRGVVTRIRHAAPQHGLGPDARRRNLVGAFRVARPTWIAGRSMLVVDDVITTGATMAACLDALGACGAHARGLVLAWAQ